MRTLARFTLDVAAANETIRAGSLAPMIENSLASLNPEAAYFYADGGKRTAIVIFDMKSPSDIPVVAEPWFMAANATVEFFPVMTADELKTGLQRLAERDLAPA